MNPDYAKITSEQFDQCLSDILREITAEQLLTIPGIYEIVSEYFNNEILENAWLKYHSK